MRSWETRSHQAQRAGKERRERACGHAARRGQQHRGQRPFCAARFAGNGQHCGRAGPMHQGKEDGVQRRQPRPAVQAQKRTQRLRAFGLRQRPAAQISWTYVNTLDKKS